MRRHLPVLLPALLAGCGASVPPPAAEPAPVPFTEADFIGRSYQTVANVFSEGGGQATTFLAPTTVVFTDADTLELAIDGPGGTTSLTLIQSGGPGRFIDGEGGTYTVSFSEDADGLLGVVNINGGLTTGSDTTQLFTFFGPDTPVENLPTGTIDYRATGFFEMATTGQNTLGTFFTNGGSLSADFAAQTISGVLGRYDDLADADFDNATDDRVILEFGLANGTLSGAGISGDLLVSGAVQINGAGPVVDMNMSPDNDGLTGGFFGPNARLGVVYGSGGLTFDVPGIGAQSGQFVSNTTLLR